MNQAAMIKTLELTVERLRAGQMGATEFVLLIGPQGMISLIDWHKAVLTAERDAMLRELEQLRTRGESRTPATPAEPTLKLGEEALKDTT